MKTDPQTKPLLTVTVLKARFVSQMPLLNMEELLAGLPAELIGKCDSHNRLIFKQGEHFVTVDPVDYICQDKTNTPQESRAATDARKVEIRAMKQLFTE